MFPIQIPLPSILLAMLALASSTTIAAAQSPSASPPRRYELLINGENFVIELGAFQELTSKLSGGEKYQVALRVAQYQPLELNTVAFDYHRGFSVVDDQGADVRTATLRHALGFVMVASDLGGPLKEGNEPNALKLVADLAVAEIRKAGGQAVDVTKPASLTIGNFSALRVGIQYQREDTAWRSLVYLLTNKKAAMSVLVEYAADDQDDVLPIVQPSLSTVRPH
ncbi:MAG: hypothetical protein KDA42_00990 [Planctomycetales bacterium]|nr:hypothetical protein [Planctomycetales bacterium]